MGRKKKKRKGKREEGRGKREEEGKVGKRRKIHLSSDWTLIQLDFRIRPGNVNLNLVKN